MRKDECVFCQIVAKEIPAKVVYEDDHIIAFLDVDALTEGHTLIIPKDHYDNLLDIDTELLKEVVVVSQKIAKKIDEAIQPEGFNVMQNTKNAGGHVNHYHMHVIPRWPEKDGVKIMQGEPMLGQDLFAKLDETLAKIKIV